MSLTQNQLSLSRVYLALLNRAPDLGGLNYWTEQLETGRSYDEVVRDIWALPQVQQMYPASVANDVFLTNAYQTLFHRAPDAAGLAYWTEQLDNNGNRGDVMVDMLIAGLNGPDGTAGKDYAVNRDEAGQYAATAQIAAGVELDGNVLIASMAQVNENPSSVVVAGGVTDQEIADQLTPPVVLTEHQASVCSLYLALFNRAPDLGGLNFWTEQLETGRPYDEVVRDVWALPQVQQMYPASVANDVFLTNAYQTLFHRAPDAAGLAYWTEQLDNNGNRGYVMVEMLIAGMNGPDGTAGKDYAVNRDEAGRYAATAQITDDVELDVAVLIDLMADVNENSSSVTDAFVKIDAEVADQSVEPETPEPTPVPTPESTPVPTPEATPVPTPESTSVPTPESTPVPPPESTPVPPHESIASITEILHLDVDTDHVDASYMEPGTDEPFVLLVGQNISTIELLVA